MVLPDLNSSQSEEPEGQEEEVNNPPEGQNAGTILWIFLSYKKTNSSLQKYILCLRIWNKIFHYLQNIWTLSNISDTLHQSPKKQISHWHFLALLNTEWQIDSDEISNNLYDVSKPEDKGQLIFIYDTLCMEIMTKNTEFQVDMKSLTVVQHNQEGTHECWSCMLLDQNLHRGNNDVLLYYRC